MTSRRIAALLSLGYMAGIAILFISGAGFLAAYLTLPASWLVVGVLPGFVQAGTLIEAALISWAGNLLLLLVSAALNIAGLYVLGRLVSR